MLVLLFVDFVFKRRNDAVVIAVDRSSRGRMFLVAVIDDDDGR